MKFLSENRANDCEYMAARVLLLGTLLTEVLRFASVAGVNGRSIGGFNAPKSEVFELDSEPKGIVVVGRRGADLKCSFGSNQKISWLRNGVPAPPCTPVQCKMTPRNSSLHFFKMVHKKNHGQRINNMNDSIQKLDEYRCIVKTAVGSLRSSPAFLELADLSYDFKESPQDLTVYEGEVARLSCFVDSVPFPPNITWKHDNKILTSDRTAKYYMVPPGILYITATKLSDAGSYKCEATNDFVKRNTRKSREAKLRVVSIEETAKLHVPVSLFPQYSYNYKLLVGSNIDLACAASGFPSHVIWKFISRFQNGTFDQPRLLLNSTNGLRVLTLRNVGPADAGIYHCSTDDPNLESQIIIVDVLIPPTFTKKPTSLDCPSGRTARFECQAEGSPKPTIYWLKDAVNLTMNRRQIIYMKEDKVELAISATIPTDSGLYQCIAVNAAGEIWAAGRLKVTTTRESPSAPTSLHCYPLSADKMFVSWKPRQSIASNSNVNGYFTVHYAPTDTNEREELVLADQGNSTFVHIVGLKPFTNYTIYVRMWRGVEASNQSSIIRCSTAESVPTAAPKINVKAISSTKLNVSWLELPKNQARGIIVEYKLQWRLRDHPSSRVINLPSNITSYVIIDLIPGTEYQVRVLGRTQFGWPNLNDSQFNWTSTMMPALNFPKLSLKNIVDLDVTNINSSTVKVRWKIKEETTENHIKFDSWHLYCQTGEEKILSSINLPKNHREYVFSNFEANFSYGIGLCMVSSNETSACLFKPIETKRLAKTSMISALEAVPASSTSINVTWFAPRLATDYHYEICYDAVQSADPQSPVCFETYNVNVTIGNLKPYTLYQIKMRIIKTDRQENSTYDETETIECYTKEDVPGTVKELQWIRNKMTPVITWKKPDKCNGVLKNYSVSYTVKSIEDWKSVTVPANNTSTTLSALVPGKQYWVRVQAATNAGYGRFSRKLSVDVGSTKSTSRLETSELTPTAEPTPKPKSDESLGVILGVSISIFCITVCLSSMYCRKRCENPPSRNDNTRSLKNQVMRNGNGCCVDQNSSFVSQQVPAATMPNEIELSVLCPSSPKTSISHVDTKGGICSNGIVESYLREPLLFPAKSNNSDTSDVTDQENLKHRRNSDSLEERHDQKLDETKLTVLNYTSTSSSSSLNNNSQHTESQTSLRRETFTQILVDPNG